LKKKTLILAATLAACGAASAQSTVTIFGVVDASYSYGSGSTSNKTQLNSGSNTSSRVGFRGTENLGGGMSASFWLEGQFNTDNGAGVATNTNNQTNGGAIAGIGGGQGFTFGRRSTVSLHAPWGEIRMGRDFTSHYLNRSLADVFAVVGVGASQPHVGTLGGTVATRASNMIGYYLPASVGPIYGQAQIYYGENNSGAANSSDGKGYSVRVGYNQGPINVSVAQGNTKYAAGDIKSTSVAALYNAGVVRLFSAYLRDANAAPANFTGKGYTLGAIVPLGTHELKLSLSKYGRDTGLKPETKKTAIGYVHNLSKRTALYATYARVTNSGGATTGLNGAVTAANNGSSGYDLGIRHNF
jgi:predicted porin